MQWGSQWSVSTHSGINPLCFYPCKEGYVPPDGEQQAEQQEEALAENPGGSSFGSVNPLLRVRAPETTAPIVETEPLPIETVAPIIETPSAQGLTTTTGIVRDERPLVYATGAFDRRQSDHGRMVDSRWPRRHRSHQVPEIDARLAVAFQKFLRDEEMEFMLLVAAMVQSGEVVR